MKGWDEEGAEWGVSRGCCVEREGFYRPTSASVQTITAKCISQRNMEKQPETPYCNILVDRDKGTGMPPDGAMYVKPIGDDACGLRVLWELLWHLSPVAGKDGRWQSRKCCGGRPTIRVNF